MTLSSLQGSLLPAALLSGIVFSTGTVPLATSHSDSLVIQVQDQPVFAGEMNELAVPYLGFVSAVSLGAGLTSIAIGGWLRSSRKSAQVEEEVSELKQHLQSKEAQLEELKFSDARLESASLGFFLQDETAIGSPEPVDAPVSPLSTPSAAAAPVQPEVSVRLAQMNQPLNFQPVLQNEPAIAATELPAVPTAPAITRVTAFNKYLTPSGAVQEAANRRTKEMATTALPAAQMFKGFTHSTAPVEPVSLTEVTVNDTTNAAPVQIDELLTHLRQVMAHIEKLNTSAEPVRTPATQTVSA